MNVTEKNWQPESGNTAYRSVKFQDEAGKNASVPKETAPKASDKISDRSDFKMQSSAPKDSVGQLASELARSETRLDVLQVLSKATRALASLKMSAYSCEGDDAKKVAQMIKRMEKLIKRIQKKVKQLGKEEQMELEQEKAEKQQKLERAKQIREELRTKRNKRRREERDYATKELAEDGKESLKETLSSIVGAGSALSGPQAMMYNAAGGIDLSSLSMEGASIDLSI